MIQIMDNTLMALEDFLPSKEDLYLFCELLFIIGVDAIELPVKLCENREDLPCGKFILHVDYAEEIEKHPNFYRYASHQDLRVNHFIYEIQINDIREMIKLKTYKDYQEVQILGLDDLLCHPYEKIMGELRNDLPNSRIIFCPENTYGCASALAIQWVLEYGTNITTSFAGCRNNAATEEVIMALRLAVRHKPNRDLTVLPQLTRLYEKFMKHAVGNRKPIIGKNIFKVEAGIHADGLQKNPATYEAFAPSIVGKTSEIVIGKHSGTKAVKLKIAQLNLPVPTVAVIDKVLHLVRDICTKHRKSLNDDEFVELLMEVAANERNKIHC